MTGKDTRASHSSNGAPQDHGVIEPWVRELLRCPNCHSTLEDIREQGPELKCAGPAEKCGLIYPITDNIPVLLISDARHN